MSHQPNEEPPAVRSERPFEDICRWAGCRRFPLVGSSLCEVHIAELVQEPLSDFVQFIQNLPINLTDALAGEAIYQAVHTAVHAGVFNRHLGHDLLRVANASRDGGTLTATIDKLVTSTRPREQGEFLIHLKRQLIIPERRQSRREAAGA
jgi:hypothetical protein